MIRNLDLWTEASTVIDPIILGATVFLGILIILLHRRLAIIPLIIAALFIPMQQRIVILSLDFTVLRILLLFGWTRIILRSEHRSIKYNTVDKVMIWWVIVTVIIFTLLWQTTGAFKNRLGLAYDALGMYFLFRFLLRNLDDIQWVIKALAILSVPLAVAMLIENSTGHNAFAIFGGVPENTLVREGRLRCQGAFAHPITAGTFGATLMPLVVSLWWQGEGYKKLAVAGTVAATIITLTSSSSGPAVAYFLAVVSLFIWVARKHMKTIRWGILILLFLLHISMQVIIQDPVWALIYRIKIFSGQTSWHRYILIDQAIHKFDEWWLVGTKTTAYWGWGLQDITNQYIVEGIRGGFLKLGLFIAIILLCFRSVGLALRTAENQTGKAKCLWALGVSLFTHTVAFFDVFYFDQIVLFWYLLLAMISGSSNLSEEAKLGIDLER